MISKLLLYPIFTSTDKEKAKRSFWLWGIEAPGVYRLSALGIINSITGYFGFPPLSVVVASDHKEGASRVVNEMILVRLKALVEFIEYADGTRVQRDGDFCAGREEYEASDQEFLTHLSAMGVKKDDTGNYGIVTA